LTQGLSNSASAFIKAEQELSGCVDQLSLKLNLLPSTEELLREIKGAMHVQLPPHNLTVIQALCDHERDKVFNQHAADTFPATRQEFGEAIQDFVVVRAGKTPARKTRKMAENAWKQDYTADRRIRQMGHSGDWESPYKGQPEKYDPLIVWAFADAIARATGHEEFSTGHHGDVTLTHENTAGGPMLRTLVAALQWAMIAAWQGAAAPGSPPPVVKPEGVLSVIRRGR
jgi:hypothetical protein